MQWVCVLTKRVHIHRQASTRCSWAKSRGEWLLGRECQGNTRWSIPPRRWCGHPHQACHHCHYQVGWADAVQGASGQLQFLWQKRGWNYIMSHNTHKPVNNNTILISQYKKDDNNDGMMNKINNRKVAKLLGFDLTLHMKSILSSASISRSWAILKSL